uniref:Uncharacterized protein n=1 Tax=viral metagenome TaxID=1070528 RepID=A0A6C0E9B8_9ZZZZ
MYDDMSMGDRTYTDLFVFVKSNTTGLEFSHPIDEVYWRFQKECNGVGNTENKFGKYVKHIGNYKNFLYNKNRTIEEANEMIEFIKTVLDERPVHYQCFEKQLQKLEYIVKNFNDETIKICFVHDKDEEQKN